MSLGIVIPVTDSELIGFRSVFAAVTENLRAADVPVSGIVVVLQTRGDGDDPDVDFLRDDRVAIVRTSRFSASHARNLGIEALAPHAPRYVLFLDSDAVPGTGLLKSVRAHLRESDRLLLGTVRWCDRWPPDDSPEESREQPVPVHRVLFSAYLWATFLPAAAVFGSGVRFDERIGPGEGTDLKSGEDVLFLHQLVSAHDVREVLRFPDAFALHPARPGDYSKHLLYARGQGALFVRLLRSRMRFDLKAAASRSLLLFLGNAVVRVLTLRPKALRIAGLRLRGLLEGFRYDAF